MPHTISGRPSILRRVGFAFASIAVAAGLAACGGDDPPTGAFV